MSTDTVLDSTDPVTVSVCSCDGLIAFGVTLDLGGHTISGSGTCIGITVGGSTVVGGRVARFGTGIGQITESPNNRLRRVQVVENSGHGVRFFGPRTVVEDCLVSRNGGPGIDLNPGDDPPAGGVVERCHVEDNQGPGIVAGSRGIVIRSNVVRRNAGRGIHVSGSDSTVSLNRVEQNGQGLSVNGDRVFGPTSVIRNVALGNLGGGVEIDGDGVLVDRNRSHYNGGEGFAIAGSAHTVTLNSAASNGEDGYAVTSVGSTFQRNSASYNGRPAGGRPGEGYGVLDTTAGEGTQGTANTYADNRCTGNRLGDSSPPGLCF